MSAEKREFALRCPHCGEECPPEFPICWSCHADLPARAGKDRGETDGSAPSSAADELAEADVGQSQDEPDRRPPRRRRIAIELAVVLLIVWLPWLVAGIVYRFEPIGPRSAGTLSWGMFQGLGILALLVYFVWLEGDWRRQLGLEQPRVAREFLFGILVLAWMLFAPVFGHSIASLLGAVESSPRFQYESGVALWLAPLDFLIYAFVEEVLYRAYLWNRLRELTGRPLLAITLASFLFAISHGYPLAGTLALFFTGWGMGVLFRERRSLWALVLGHWLCNLYITFGESAA